MKKYCRVFLKGEPMRWFDFPLDPNGTLFAFVAQMRFEGYAMSEAGMIVYDEVRAVMLIQTMTPSMGLSGMMPAGQA
jgi:hypothetical protein